jgi:hypothetical protein
MLTNQARSDQFLEIRWPAAGGWKRQFFRARDENRAAWRICEITCHGDVYVGVALRDSNAAGGKSAISGSRLVFIDSDRPDCEQLFAGFAHPPTIEIASGAPGHRHLYWLLTQRAESERVESANRRLALQFHGDPASVDVARILRPPGTLNYRHLRPRPVKLFAYRPHARYSLAELIRELPADPRQSDLGAGDRPRSSRTERSALDRELLAIPAAEYVAVLVGATPTRAGKIRCPFHHDTDPSLQLYADGTFYCFGSHCRRGGTIFDFAAAKWQLGTRGSDFLELRRRLAASFGLRGR